MLRISTVDEIGQIVYLKVEGRLVGAWVTELDHVCTAMLAQQKEGLELDFSAVDFIDRQGIDLLKRLVGERVQIMKARPLVKALLDV